MSYLPNPFSRVRETWQDVTGMIFLALIVNGLGEAVSHGELTSQEAAYLLLAVMGVPQNIPSGQAKNDTASISLTEPPK